CVSCAFLLMRLLPCFALFPYTTLFRSLHALDLDQVEMRLFGQGGNGIVEVAMLGAQIGQFLLQFFDIDRAGKIHRSSRGRAAPRSEEHTSELQSREKLVCRLLLEKKK